MVNSHLKLWDLMYSIIKSVVHLSSLALQIPEKFILFLLEIQYCVNEILI